MKKSAFLVIIAILAIGLFVPQLAHASNATGGTEFQSLYNKLIGWVQGLPGIMGAIILLVVGIYLSFVGGRSPMYFFLTALGAAAIFLIPGIAQGLAGATWFF